MREELLDHDGTILRSTINNFHQKNPIICFSSLYKRLQSTGICLYMDATQTNNGLLIFYTKRMKCGEVQKHATYMQCECK